MKFNFTELSYDPAWYYLETLEPLETGVDPADIEQPLVQVRAYPMSMSSIRLASDGTTIIDGRDRLKMFNYCWTDHRNLDDGNDKPLVLTDKIKTLIFDFRIHDIPQKVLTIVDRLAFRKVGLEKN